MGILTAGVFVLLVARRRKFQGAALLAALLVSSSAHATIISVAPAKDNTLFEPYSFLSEGGSQYLFAGETSINAGPYARRALIQFDLSGIPAGSVINSASLTLTLVQPVPSGNTAAISVSLHTISADWGEAGSNNTVQPGLGASAQNGDATWRYRFYNTASPASSPAWATAGGDFGATVSAATIVSSNATYTFSSAQLAADVQSWVNGATPNYGWTIVGDETQIGTAKRFASRESATGQPQLTVNFSVPVPEPGTTFFSLVGLAILAQRRNTQRTARR
jgi:hypothetical protein